MGKYYTDRFNVGDLVRKALNSDAYHSLQHTTTVVVTKTVEGKYGQLITVAYRKGERGIGAPVGSPLYPFRADGFYKVGELPPKQSRKKKAQSPKTVAAEIEAYREEDIDPIETTYVAPFSVPSFLIVDDAGDAIASRDTLEDAQKEVESWLTSESDHEHLDIYQFVQRGVTTRSVSFAS